MYTKQKPKKKKIPSACVALSSAYYLCSCFLGCCCYFVNIMSAIYIYIWALQQSTFSFSCSTHKHIHGHPTQPNNKNKFSLYFSVFFKFSIEKEVNVAKKENLLCSLKNKKTKIKKILIGIVLCKFCVWFSCSDMELKMDEKCI